MKKCCVALLIVLSTLSTFAQRPERTSENTLKLAELLEMRPQLDQNRDGILTMKEAFEGRDRKKRPAQPNQIAPTFADVSYGNHPSMKLDFWKADSGRPSALVVWIHGGGFRSGDKAPANSVLLKAFLDAGVSFASINYRLSDIGPYPMQMNDSARAIQFLRSKAGEWNIDPDRIAAGGGSAGSGISQWLAFHDDLADPESSNPIEHFSTRLRCALALNMQSTYDPRIIKEIIPGSAYKNNALPAFYGLSDDWNLSTAEIDADLDALFKDASPINHLTKDDPPVFVFHTERTRTDGNIHHPNFGNHLENAMQKLGIECVRRTDADYSSPNAQYDEMIEFTLKHLGVSAE